MAAALLEGARRWVDFFVAAIDPVARRGRPQRGPISLTDSRPISRSRTGAQTSMMMGTITGLRSVAS